MPDPNDQSQEPSWLAAVKAAVPPGTPYLMVYGTEYTPTTITACGLCASINKRAVMAMLLVVLQRIETMRLEEFADEVAKDIADQERN